MTKQKTTIINQLSIIFDQLEKIYEDKVTFYDIISYLYKNVPKGSNVDDIITIELLLKYIFENQETE